MECRHGDRKRKPVLPPPSAAAGDAVAVLHPVPDSADPTPARPAPVSGGEA